MIRLRSCETDSPATWEETRQAIAGNPGCCDEVWFSTGISYPPLEAHRVRAAKQAKAAADCRRLGIEPGLQIQATLGHSDDITVSGGDVSAKNWTGWTGSQGVEDKWCSCPRDPKFIAYFEEVGRIYAAYRPTSVWIDDDLRIDNHWPATDGSLPGCWCARCVGDFARETGVARPRETLAAAVKADATLAARWERFQFASLAEFARRVAKAVAEVSPETRMGYQHCLRADGLQTLVYDAMREASGHAVRSRPGGGAYFDYDPRDQLIKAYFMARQRAALSGAKDIEQFCPEIETCPRKFSCRTPRGVLLESLENLALGMDSLSFLITDSRFEKMSWYGRTFFRALAANRACLRGYAEASRGAEPTGLRYAPAGKAGAEIRELRWTAYCSGVPLVGAFGRDVGAYDEFVRRNGGKLDVTASSTAEIVARSKLADQVAGGRLPVVLEDPVVGFVMPRTTASGELKTVAFVNTSIGCTEPTRLRLRGVPAAAKKGVWWAFDSTAVELPLTREGKDVVVTLPPVEGWSGGWLGFEGDERVAVYESRNGSLDIDAPALTVKPQLFLKGWSMTGAGGQVKLTARKDGALGALYVRRNEEPCAIEQLNLIISLSVREYGGLTLRTESRDIRLPVDYGSMSVSEGKLRSLEIRPVEGRDFVRIAFAEPVGYMIQDNRRFGGSDFEIRFHIASSTTLEKGRIDRLAFTLSGARPFQAEPQRDMVIKAGTEWIPIKGGGEVAPGTALDFTETIPTDAPAGCHGRVLAKGDHFVFADSPDVPRRFYGVNLCFHANFLDRETARTLAKRLRRVGYNAVRFHHHDGGLVHQSGDGTTVNPKVLEMFDGLLAACVEEGLYVTTDLFVSRQVPWKTLGIDRSGVVPMDEFKSLVRTNAAAQVNLKTFVRQWFTHVNPYTGRRWADEPALAWISLVNENNPGNHGEPVDETLMEKEIAFAREMKRFLREELGCLALVTDMNGWQATPLHQKPRETVYDYVDNHFYVDHPHFLERPWRLPSFCPNVNPVCKDNCGMGNVDGIRVKGKPFTITEYNYSGPGRFRGVGGIATGAAGATRDWAGLWRFAWSHSDQTIIRPGSGQMGYFDISSDPLSLASERASLMLFRRGDLAVGETPRIDRKAGSFILDTPRTSGGFCEGGRIDAGALRADLSRAATVWASSLDGQPLAASGHVLLTHLTDVQNTDIVYGDRRLTVLKSFGHLPYLMRAGTAEISLAVRGPSVRVYALAADGTRRGEVPVTVRNGRLSFTCSVARDPAEATYLYEIVTVPASRVYSVPACEERNAAGYAVKVDGTAAPVLAVRNSAMPVNIRWPGHQRELDQTEIGGLVRFAFSGAAKVEVTAPRDFQDVKIRPLSKGVKPTVNGRSVAFTLMQPGGYSVEFDGIHTNLLVLADPPADYRVDPKAKGTIYFGPGEHEPGLITLKSGETLYIDEGAVVFGRVEAKDADHIRILGRGILDGSRIKAKIVPIDPALEAEQRRKGFAITNYKRWDEIVLSYCDDVLIDGITIRDSLLYNIRPISCRGLTIRNVKLCGNWRYNSDGIDMHNCENVRISDCFLRTFDDAICVKGYDYRMDERDMLHDGYCHNVFTNAVIERCTVWCDWGLALEFGAETRAKEIRDITFRDCDVIRVQGGACDIQNCDYADIHDVRFENIRVELDSPVYRTAYSARAADFNPEPDPAHVPPFFGAAIRMIPEYSKDGTRRGQNRAITLKDIRIVGPKRPWFRVDGYDAEHRTTGVTMEGIYWNGKDITSEVKGSIGRFADPPQIR